MANTNTSIEWADATWSPVTGCTKVSQGCKNCYAERVFQRVYAKTGRKFTDVLCHPDRLDAPLHWRKPRRVFVASMADPNHQEIPDSFRDQMLAVISRTERHSYQWLTKRAGGMLDYFSSPDLPFRVLRAIDVMEVNEAMAGVDLEWRPLPSAPVYEISNHGRVRRGGVELALSHHGGGYLQVAICTNGAPRSELVHRLVLEAFDRPGVVGEECAHRNGDRKDNRIANLRWASKTENMRDAAKHGTAGVWMKGRTTLTHDEIADIRDARARGDHLGVIASRFSVTKQQVSAICLNKIFKPAQIDWPLRNLHLGVSVEDQATADERIPPLLQTPSAVRFVSAEPLLGDVRLGSYLQLSPSAAFLSGRVTADMPGWTRIGSTALDWVIVGGESGPKARPCRVEWIESIIRQCKSANVPCFVKQLGQRPVWGGARARPIEHARGKCNDPAEWPLDLRVREYPEMKKRDEAA